LGDEFQTSVIAPGMLPFPQFVVLVVNQMRDMPMSHRKLHHWSKNTMASIVVPTTLTAMTAMPTTRQISA